MIKNRHPFRGALSETRKGKMGSSKTWMAPPFSDLLKKSLKILINLVLLHNDPDPEPGY
jgi:hypothetical protein